MKPEELDTGDLEPEAQRRLIDGHESTGIKGSKEPIVPTERHTPHSRSIVDIAIPILVNTVEVQYGGQDQDADQRQPLPPGTAAR